MWRSESKPQAQARVFVPLACASEFQQGRPVRSLPPSKPLTGPAPPWRTVCAPDWLPSHPSADQGEGESDMSRHKHRTRLRFEALEARVVPSVLDLTGIEWRTIDGTNN